MEDFSDLETKPLAPRVAYSLPALHLRVEPDGPERTFLHHRVTVGSDPDNDVVLPTATVSRFHAEIVRRTDAWRVVDLDSTNGTLLDDVRIRDAYLSPGCRLDVGGTLLTVGRLEQVVQVAESEEDGLGELAGRSAAMRQVYGFVRTVAPTDAAVLLTGETGTGKDVAARTLHAFSRRSDRPFVVVDCASIPASIIESELFGHEKGSFSGALAGRRGLIEMADRGTLFLDEIGELPLDLQPRLLRVLETGEVRRVGADRSLRVDFRLVAATNRDLAGEVAAGRFRKDLFYRLAVVPLHLPPLRERREDIPVLVDRVLASSAFNRGPDGSLRKPRLSPHELAALAAHDFPGNVRELVHVLERCVLLGTLVTPKPPNFSNGPCIPVGEGGHPHGQASAPAGIPVPSPPIPFARAKEHAVIEFERAYLADLMERCDGNLTEASRRAGVDRKHLRSLLRKVGLYEKE